MKIFPISYAPQKSFYRNSSVASANKATLISNTKNYPQINFKGADFNYRQFAFAFEKLASMGIKGETIFFDKKILKELPKEPEKFEEFFNKLEQSYQILKKISNYEHVVQKFLHTKNPDIDKFHTTITAIKDAGIFSEVLKNIFNFIHNENEKEKDWNEGLDKTLELLDLRKAVLANKEFLSQFNRNSSPVDIDFMLFSYPYATSNTLEILGEKGFVHSLKDKIDNVNTYIATLGLSPWRGGIREKLIEYTNTRKSQRYQILKQEIAELKQQYKNNLHPEIEKKLQKEINTATYALNEMIKKSIKDPKDIFERSLMVCELQNYSSEHAKDLLKVISPQNPEENKHLKDVIKSKLIISYELDKIPNIENTIEKIELQNSKYLPSFFKAKNSFRKAFKDYIKLFALNPNKNILEIYNQQEANINTRRLFTKYGVNYDKYVNYNPEIEVNDIRNLYGDKTNLKVKKVDMNNFIKTITLGNDAGCCTKLGGSQEKSAISYAKNKMFSAIEVLDGENPVGNTMCYFAIVNNQLSFVLDNIEIKREYAYNDSIRDAIIKCARKLTDEATNGEKIPIYIGAQRNKISTNDLPLEFFNIQLIGDSGKDEVYIDFMWNIQRISEYNSLFNDILLHDVTHIADNTPIAEFDTSSYMGRIVVDTDNSLNLYINTDGDENL